MAGGTLENLSKSSFVRTPPLLGARIYRNLLSFAALTHNDDPANMLVTVLDPAAGEGDLLVPLLDLPRNEFIHCSAIEISAERAFLARTRLAALAPAIFPTAFEGIKIPPRTLSLVVTNPPYFFVNGRRAEYQFVTRSTQALVDDGILVAIIPARSAWDRRMVTFLTRWFDDIRLWKFPSQAEGEEECPFEKYTQMIVVGRKRAEAHDLDEARMKALLAYRWRKDADGNEGWAGMVAPPTLPTEPLTDPYLVPLAPALPHFETQDASDAQILETLLGNPLSDEPGTGADCSPEWMAATTWKEEVAVERPAMPYTGVAHVAAEIMTGMLGGEVIHLDGRPYLLSAFVGSEWSKMTIDADTKQNLRDKGVVSASAKQMQDYPVLGVLDLEKGQTTYYEGDAVFDFLLPWISVLAAYAQQKRPPLYQLDPQEWELRVLSQFGLDKQLPRAQFPGLAPAQMHRVFAMGRSLDEHGLIAIHGEPGTGKTRMAVAAAARQAYAWQHRHDHPGKKQPPWMQQLRRTWLKNPRTLAMLDLAPVYGERLPNTEQGIAQIREDRTTGQVVAYRKQQTGTLVLPEEAGPRAMPVLVMTPKKVTKEYEKEIRAAWPQAETIMVQHYEDIPRFLRRCVESVAPAVIAVCSHSQSQPRGSGRIWQPAVLEVQKQKQTPILEPAKELLSHLEAIKDERERVVGYRFLESGEQLTEIVSTRRFRCPECFGVIEGIPGGQEPSTQQEEGPALLQQDEEENEELKAVVESRIWFEKKPRWCTCEQTRNQERRRRHQKPLRGALWTEARTEHTEGKYPGISYGEWARVIDLLKHEAQIHMRPLASLCSSTPAFVGHPKKGQASAPVRKLCRIVPVQEGTAPIQVPGTAQHPSPHRYDLSVPPPDSFGVYEYLIRFFKGCVALSIIDESHNGRAANSDIARAMHRAMRAAQTHMLTSGTHFGGDIVSFFFYWFRFHPQFWRKLGLKWRQASEAQRRYGVIQMWIKEYESDARKGGGKTSVQVSTVPAPGLSAKLIPYLLELLTFLTVLDVGAFMPPKVEIPEVVSMWDEEVEKKAQEAAEILKAPQRALVALTQEKQLLFTAIRDGKVEREALVEWSHREEAARLALEEAREESARLTTWVNERNLLGSYLRVVQSLAKKAREGNQTARMAQGTIPRWFAVLPCEKPFELWQTRRTAWGDELRKDCLLDTPRLAWDYLYPLEKRLIKLVQKELAERRRCMLYIDQNDERSMGKRLQWVLQQVTIDSWILPNQVKPEDRQQAIIDAMSPGLDGKPAVTVAIVPYARVNEGINLQTVVDTIIWYEMALNLFMLEQASRRAWRLGKREEVRIYYLAYAGTAGHQKMRKLGGQSGAAASFAGEPARGALIEEAGADRTTLARFSATVETELLVDDEEGETDRQALVDVTDEEDLKAAFSRRAAEEREVLGRGRTWLGATDCLSEQLPAFFTGPQRSVWKKQLTLHQVQAIRSRDVEAPVPTEIVEGALVAPVVEAVPPVLSASEVPPASIVLPTPTTVPASGPSPLAPVPSQKEAKPAAMPPTSQNVAKPQIPETRVGTATTLIFGNLDHILLGRQRRTKGKANNKQTVKRPRVQAEVKDIPAVEEEHVQPIAAPKTPAKKKATHGQGPTLWEFCAQEPLPEQVPLRMADAVPVSPPEQLALF